MYLEVTIFEFETLCIPVIGLRLKKGIKLSKNIYTFASTCTVSLKLHLVFEE